MNSIFTLFSALANLARSFNRLASVVDAVSTEAERRVEVIGYTPAPTAAILGTAFLEENGHAEPVKTGGRVRK